MPIYLTHKEHGAHVVYFEHDAVDLEKTGWVRKTEENKEPPKEPQKRKYVRKPK